MASPPFAELLKRSEQLKSQLSSSTQAPVSSTIPKLDRSLNQVFNAGEELWKKSVAGGTFDSPLQSANASRFFYLFSFQNFNETFGFSNAEFFLRLRVIEGKVSTTSLRFLEQLFRSPKVPLWSQMSDQTKVIWKHFCDANEKIH